MPASRTTSGRFPGKLSTIYWRDVVQLPKLYFDTHSAMKEGLNAYALKEVLFMRPNVEQPARLKRSATFKSAGGGDYQAHAGTTVHVWRTEEGYQVRMRWYNDGRAIDSPQVESWDMWDWEEFDIELLDQGEQKRVKGLLEWCKKTLQGYFAPKSDQEAFGKDLLGAVQKWWPKITEDEDLPKMDPTPAFNIEDIHGAWGAVLKKQKFAELAKDYNAWSEMIEMFAEILKGKFFVGNVHIISGENQQKQQAASQLYTLGSPEGADLRSVPGPEAWLPVVLWGGKRG